MSTGGWIDIRQRRRRLQAEKQGMPRRMTSPGVMTDKGHDRKREWKECEWVLMRSIGVKQEKGRSPPFLCVEKKEQQRLEIHYDNNKRFSNAYLPSLYGTFAAIYELQEKRRYATRQK